MRVRGARCFGVWQLGWILAVALVGGVRGVEGGSTDAAPRNRSSVAVEALLKLQNIDLNQNTKLKDAVYRILEQVRGTPDFVRLVQKFQLTDQAPGMLEVVVHRGAEDAGVEALRWLFEHGGSEALFREAQSTNASRVIPVITAMGAAGDARVVSNLVSGVLGTNREISIRKESVKALAHYQEGAKQLVQWAEAGRLPNELQFTARNALSTVRWPEIRAAAAKALPSLDTQSAQPLPPVAELIRKSGDPAKGRVLFMSKATCSTCHQIHGQGVNFGPELTQIGSKLGKDAIYEAILDPSAGISFGFESWLLTLKSGDEAYGLISSETETDVSIKAPGGLITKIPKSDIVKREKQTLSAMPTGLQAALTTQELVDLVEFLSLQKQTASSAP